MLELDEVTLRNFMSYGDYPTTLKLSNGGICLITGEIAYSGDTSENDELRSNGAGKSALTNAILWGLFGRTMHSAAPGNKVINFHTKKDCSVRLTFKNGDIIDRVRTREGKTELLFTRGGNENRVAADTVSTTRLMQAKLAREFGLDWEVLCGSAFFSQYNRPWMEMPDAQRKNALERILHVDRYSVYTDICKEKCSKIDSERETRRAKLDATRQNIKSAQEEIIRLDEQEHEFESSRSVRKRQYLREAAEAVKSRDLIQLPDMDKLRARWDVVESVRAKIVEDRASAVKLRRRANGVQNEVNSKLSDAKDHRRKADAWLKKKGKMCLECEQEVPHSHVGGKIEPIVAQAEAIEAECRELQARVDELKAESDRLEKQADSYESKLSAKLPKMTISAANELTREWNSWDREAARATARAEAVEGEENPYSATKTRTEERLKKLAESCKVLEDDLAKYDILYAHYNYIGKSYGDRRKVKAYVLAERIPFVNSRLAYYLNLFELDMRLSFNESLGIESDMWGYDFFCGGERKRVDLALMFAIFDLHDEMYGRQCNVVVLDEVDGRLDGVGINSLVNVIRDDIAAKVETVLVVSHKDSMREVFPRQINVRRSDRMSYIEEAR